MNAKIANCKSTYIIGEKSNADTKERYELEKENKHSDDLTVVVIQLIENQNLDEAEELLSVQFVKLLHEITEDIYFSFKKQLVITKSANITKNIKTENVSYLKLQ